MSTRSSNRLLVTAAGMGLRCACCYSLGPNSLPQLRLSWLSSGLWLLYMPLHSELLCIKML